MHFVELVCQSVRGFPASVRLTFQPGYQQLQPASNTPVPLSQVLTGVLFADGRGSDAGLATPGARDAEVAVTLDGNDGQSYRLTRKLGGGGALVRLSNGQAEPVSEDAAESNQFLRSQAGLPPRSTFEQLYTFTAQQLPSRRPPKGPAGARASSPASAPADPAEVQARLSALQKELALSLEIDGLQFKIDGASSELFNVGAVINKGDGLLAALAEAEQAYAQSPTTASLKAPADLLQRVETFKTAAKRRDEALAKLGELGEHELFTSSVPPLYREPRFWAGLGLGAVFLVAGLMMEGYVRFVALLDIPAFGFAGLVALKHVERLQAATLVGRKGGVRERREKKILAEYAAEAQPVQAAMEALSLDSLSELVEALGRRELSAKKVADLRAQRARFEATPEYRNAFSNQTVLKADHQRWTDELSQKGGGYVREAREVEREIAKLKESLSPTAGAPAVAPEASQGPSKPEDPLPAVLSLGSDFFATDVPAFAATLKDRCAQYLAALSDKRFVGVEFDKDGRGTVVGAARTPLLDLPPKDIDLVYLAVRLTVVEKCTARAKLPLLIEDGVAAVPEAKYVLLGRMLKHLGTLTQVIQVTGHPGFAGLTDQVTKL